MNVPAPGGPQRVVILGGGTGGTLVANRLRRRFSPTELAITVVDQDDRHVYQPGLLFVPFGLTTAEQITRPRHAQLHQGIAYEQAAIDHVDLERQLVHLEGEDLETSGEGLPFDALVIATGSVLVPEETEGLDPYPPRVHTFYDPAGATRLASAFDAFQGGRLVVNVIDLPIKCPVAPLEFCFLADWYFQDRHLRDRVEITFVTPLDGAITKPVASAALGDLLVEKGVELVTEFNTATVDGDGGRLVSYDGRAVDFDLAVVVPLHGGARYVARSPGLGDELGFVAVDEHTLQAPGIPGVFAIGDAAGVPTSKAGSVTHFEGEVVVENVARFLAHQPLDASFDGHTNCFIETGFHKALLIDFNYDTEPLPGHYPSEVGLPLLRQSRLNHLGKLLFQPLYWHALLPGRDVPGISSSMPTHGKKVPATSSTTSR